MQYKVSWRQHLPVHPSHVSFYTWFLPLYMNPLSLLVARPLSHKNNILQAVLWIKIHKKMFSRFTRDLVRCQLTLHKWDINTQVKVWIWNIWFHTLIPPEKNNRWNRNVHLRYSLYPTLILLTFFYSPCNTALWLGATLAASRRLSLPLGLNVKSWEVLWIHFLHRAWCHLHHHPIYTENCSQAQI